jgi:hypothetical protein
LWTVRSLLSRAPTLDQGTWRTKIAWFTRPFGIPRFGGRRLDGAGTFHGEGNAATDQHGTWVASSLEFSAAGCWEVTVSYENTKIVVRILVGAERGTISGRLREVGGPAPGLDRSVPGTISIEGDSTAVGASTSTGEFSVQVPVGTYTVTGTSPLVNDGREKCVVSDPVIVESGRTTKVTVICPIR